MTETKRVSDAALNLILRGCQIEVHVVGGALEALSLDLRDERAANEALRLAHAKAMAVVEAARAVLVPMRGVHGGPLCTIKGIYEDGTDEVSARHRGNIAHEDMQRLTDALAAYSAPLTEEKA